MGHGPRHNRQGPHSNMSDESKTPAPSSTSQRTSGTPARTVPSWVVAILLVIIAAQLIAISILVMRPTSPAPSGDTTQSANTSAQTQSSHENPDSTTPTPPAESDEFAASHTDPKALEIIRAQARRDPADGQAKGKTDAPVVLVLWSDFACPWCTKIAHDVDPALADLVEKGTLRVEWRDLAQITETSPLAAQAGLAAAEQGKFWQFHDAVYAAADPTDHPSYSEESLVEFAKAAGVADLDKFRATMNSPETAAKVTQSKESAYSIGIQGTPFMMIGDAVISGYRDPAYVRRTVLEQAKIAQAN